MKEYLQKVIDAKTKEANEIREKVKNANSENSSVEEVRALGETLEKVLGELNDAKEQLANLEEEPAPEEEEPRAEGDEEETPAEEGEEEPVEEEEDPTENRSGNWVKVKSGKELRKVSNFEEEKTMDKELREKQLKELEVRGKALVEGRAITVGASDVLLPGHQSSELAPAPFRQVSTFVDLTKKRPLDGGESYEAPFTKSYGEGGLTAEGADYATAEPEFGKVRIDKVKITAYAEVSEELEKLPAADYASEVQKGVEIALKKKLAKEQINGTGASNSLVGILSKAENNKCVLEADDLPIAEINADTLNEIIFNYGGDEEVEQKGVLVLNKADLLAFSKVRNEVGDHAYKIDLANQTINTVPYIINSNCKALSAESTAEGDYTMFYGIPQHYETAIFSPVEIMKSYDYKFKQGMVCYKASVFVGGNTTSYRGFMRIKKAAVPTA